MTARGPKRAMLPRPLRDGLQVLPTPSRRSARHPLADPRPHLPYLSLTASLVFEQSYGGIEGDSASSAELYALLSAIGAVPLTQSLAVTGSVNQHGEVQPIGGVNEKIEGFFEVCAARGLSGEQGVLIPQANAKDLMLRAPVREAVQDHQFYIYPVATIDEGMERLTGEAMGKRRGDGTYPPGSINERVASHLERFAEERTEFQMSPDGHDAPLS